MSKSSVAEASAPSSRISTQGSGPSTPPEHTIGRNGEINGNTYPRKSLTQEEKDKLIQAAIQKTLSYPILEWGGIDLYNLFSYGATNYVGSERVRRFFLQLLLFVARPEIAKDFGDVIPDGLEIIGKLSRFFGDLDDSDHQQEFLDYNDVEWGVKEEKYKNIAKRYLAGAELEMVLSEEKPEPKASPTPWYMKPLEVQEEPCDLTVDQLVEALDRYYPGQPWPTDKRAIATHERMKAHLVAREKERISILTETPEQKEKRLANDAVYLAVTGPSIPALIRSVGATVAAAAKPKSGTTPAKTATSKPTTTKKKA